MEKPQYSINDVYDIAGKDLTDMMLDVFTKKEKVVRWFYKPNKALGNKKPYELCEDQEFSKIEKLLGAIDHGNFS